MRYYLGIDIGTFESKGVLVDESGAIAALATRPHKMLVPQPGWAEHDPDQDWWGDFCFLSKKLIADSGIDPKDIKSVGASAIGPCMLPVDAEGNALMNGVLYGVDTRAAKEIEDLNAEIGVERILEVSGNALTSQSVGPKILWLKNNRPEIYEKAAKIVSSTTYLVQKLTGNCVIDHYTAANFSPLYDVGAQRFSDDLTKSILPLEKLPKLLWTTEVAGTVTSAASAATGLDEGTPVICGTIDAAAEAFSVGVLSAGDMMVMYGSTIFIILLSEQRVRDSRLWYAPWFFPGEHASMSGLATSGTLTHWFRDQIGRDLDPATAFGVLAQEAASSKPGANGLVFLPYFSGERTPIHDTHAKGMLFGLNLTHTRGDIYRALIEGIACGTNHIFETYAAAGARPARLIAVGGGTKNQIWLEATSNISGLPQIMTEKSMGASYGNAFLAALGIGDVSRDQIKTWNPVEREVPAVHDPAYDRQYQIFLRLYQQTKDLMAELDAPL
ncbi:FGGY-family carbohydrate kinase [Rhizobium sp. KVB221]|uniref:FGGY-family carbohydrate kinase n=1 Tax=Rhizobium setariae TaxID=2801340 RepID=A0A937CQ09_9HYPH|nr:FGGY-family carbohydrate kinase [Rhizobium setariae]MBL0372412.1 FGGY-family carbohydrate kinase [Rhizobium setariae]